MRIQQRLSLGWSGVLLATTFMMLASGLILYPKTTHENILTALRLSSVTNVPAFTLFLAGAIMHAIVGWRRLSSRVSL